MTCDLHLEMNMLFNRLWNSLIAECTMPKSTRKIFIYSWEWMTILYIRHNKITQLPFFSFMVNSSTSLPFACLLTSHGSSSPILCDNHEPSNRNSLIKSCWAIKRMSGNMFLREVPPAQKSCLNHYVFPHLVQCSAMMCIRGIRVQLYFKCIISLASLKN